MEDQEIWKDIPGYEGIYKISRSGKVSSFKLKKSLSQSLNRKGYPMVTLCVKGRKSISVHRLMALTFIQNPENKQQVNHKNGIKTDNRVENLEWNTPSENVVHSYEIGIASNKGERHPTAMFDNAKVLKLREEYKSGVKVKKLADENGTRYDTMWRIVTGRNYQIAA